jgi:hypothetical protein
MAAGAAAPALGQVTAKEVVAAAVRDRGYPCAEPVSVQRDVERSSPDEKAWIIYCQDGRYRVRFMGDAGARVTPIPGATR